MVGDVIAELGYLTKTTDGRAAYVRTASKSGPAEKNFGHVPVVVTIHDLRGRENSVDLDTNGLEILKYEGSVQEEFEDRSEEQKFHYEEIADIVKKRLGASRVITFQHIFRYRGPPLPSDKVNMHLRNPGLAIHIDINQAGVQQLIKQMFGEKEAKKILQKRYASVNVWRPIGDNAITDKPLAICDYRSLDIEKDIQPLEIRSTTYGTSANTITLNDSHRWYYLSEMRSNEMFLFKMCDSKADTAHCAFHTAFINKNVPPSTNEQKSLEMRFIVLYD